MYTSIRSSVGKEREKMKRKISEAQNWIWWFKLTVGLSKFISLLRFITIFFISHPFSRYIALNWLDFEVEVDQGQGKALEVLHEIIEGLQSLGIPALLHVHEGTQLGSIQGDVLHSEHQLQLLPFCRQRKRRGGGERQWVMLKGSICSYDFTCFPTTSGSGHRESSPIVKICEGKRKSLKY